MGHTTAKIAVLKPKSTLYIGLFLMIIKVFVPLSKILPQSALVDNILSLASAGILALDIIQQKLDTKRLVVYGVVTILALYTSSITGQYGFLITVIAILAIAGRDFDKIIYFIYHWELLLFVAHTIIALVWNFLPETSIVQSISGVMRFNFGFGHPNTFSAYLFNLIIMWVWLNYNRITNKHIVLVFLLGIVNYTFTRTRTSTLDIVIFCILIMLAKHFADSAVLSSVSKLIVPVCAGVVLILIVQFPTGNPVVLLIDNILSARIRLGSYAYYHYGLTAFGQSVSFTDVVWDSVWRLNGLTFDCTYTSLMVMQGVVWLVILSVGFFLLGCKKDNRISISIIVWALYAVTEVHGMNGFLCFPILLLALLLKPTNKMKKMSQT